MSRDEQVRRFLEGGPEQKARFKAGEEVHNLLGDMIEEAELSVGPRDGPLGPMRPILRELWDATDEPTEEDPLVPMLLRAALKEVERRRAT